MLEVEEQMNGKVRDPVCGMEFAEEQATTKVEYEGQTYHFCTQACRRQFEKDPKKYAKSSGAEGRAPHR